MLEIEKAPKRNHDEELLDVIDMLYDYKRQNIDACYVFNGVKLFAHDITNPSNCDPIFQKVYGCTYDEYKSSKEEEKYAEWLNGGYKIIPEKRQSYWKEYVMECAKNDNLDSVMTLLRYLNMLSLLNLKTDEESVITILDALDAIDPELVGRLAYFSSNENLIRNLYKEKVNKEN